MAELGKNVGNFQNFSHFIKSLESINDMQLKELGKYLNFSIEVFEVSFHFTTFQVGETI